MIKSGVAACCGCCTAWNSQKLPLASTCCLCCCACRRELLAATRYVLTGPHKGACFSSVIGDVLQEGVLLGSSMASMDTLKPLAVRNGK